MDRICTAPFEYLGAFVPIWLVITVVHKNITYIKDCVANYFLARLHAGDDHCLTLLKRGCANSVVGLEPEKARKPKTITILSKIITRMNQWTAKGASGKRPRQKTPKTVRKCRKYFRHFSTFFGQGKKRQKLSKYFRHFSRGTSFLALWGGGGGSE